MSNVKRKSPQLKLTSKSKEPWWGKTQKITAAILSVLALAGILWSTVSKADARYAKEQAVAKEVQVIKQDIALLGKAFQYDQLDRATSNKQDQVFKLNERLRQRISPDERFKLEEIKRNLELEIERLKIKQKKFE